MKKYILSAAITLTLSSSSLAGKENSYKYDLDFYIGKTSLYSQKNFNSKVEGRELYEDIDPEVMDEKKVEGQIKTQGTITTPYSWNFLDLNHKIGGKFFFPIGSGFSLGLEIASINPLNFRFEDLIKSKYTASEGKHEFYGKAFVYKKNNTVFVNDNDFFDDSINDLLNKNFLYKNHSISEKIYGLFGGYYFFLLEENFKNLGFNEVKAVKDGKIIKPNGDEITSTEHNAEFKPLEAKIRDLGKNLHREDFIYFFLLNSVLNAKIGTCSINTETTKAIKTAFITPSIRYNINLNDNFDVNIFAKIGGGFLSITEKSCTILKLQNASDEQKEQNQQLRIEDYTSAVIVKQEDITFAGGLEASLIYDRSDAFSTSLTFGVNVYGKTPKAVDSIFYKTDDATKADISLMQLGKAKPEEKNKSWFGLVDATLAVNFTMNL